MQVRQLKNGEYDIHLDFQMMYFMRNLLNNWINENYASAFGNHKQGLLLKEMDAAINIPEEVLDEIETERLRREFYNQFLDDNNPEGYRTKDNWRNIDKCI